MDINAEKFFKPDRSDIELKGPVIVGVDIQTPENMGLILRASSNFGCQKVLFAYSSDDSVSKKNQKIRRTARNAFELLPWQFVKITELDQYLPKEYVRIGLETSENSKNIYDFLPLPRQVVIFLGSESKGLPSSILESIDQTYFIPMLGRTISMNVTHALVSMLSLWCIKS